MPETPDWLDAGSKAPAGDENIPEVSWTFSSDAPLVTLQLARETGEVLAADESGGLYLLDRHGQITSVARGPSPIRGLAWGDTGGRAVVLVGDNTLYWLNRDLKFEHKLELSEKALYVALDAHGQYATVSLADGTNLIFDSPKKPIRRFTTPQPMVGLEYFVREQAIIGVAEYGVLCKYGFDGDELWRENLWSNVGDMTITGNGDLILLACFSHGVQKYSGQGDSIGSYQLGGTVSRISVSYSSSRLIVATIERQLYWLNMDGQILWVADLPEDVRSVACDSLGTGAVCGFQSGKIFRLQWN